MNTQQPSGVSENGDKSLRIPELKFTAEAFAVLRNALQVDEHYAQGWHDNLACAAMDEGVDSPTAQKIATRFMKNCFNVNTRQR